MPSRQVVRLVLLVIVAGLSWYLGKPQNASSPLVTPGHPKGEGAFSSVTWGRPETLPDHFARHGKDFHAQHPAEYAAQAHAFLLKAKAVGFPAKRDYDGSLRIYDASSDTFGAYNADGTTKTFFKPGSPTYFDRQPGTPVDLRSLR